MEQPLATPLVTYGDRGEGHRPEGDEINGQ